MYLCEYRYIIFNVTEYYNSLSIFFESPLFFLFRELGFLHKKKVFLGLLKKLAKSMTYILIIVNSS